LKTEGLIRSQKGQDYPLHIKSVFKNSHIHRVFKNEAELLEAIFEELGQPYNKGKKIKQIIFEEFGFHNTALLVDKFSVFLIEEYEYYKSPATPHAPYQYNIWRDAVLIFEELQPRLF
jgi:hypothetical protein